MKLPCLLLYLFTFQMIPKSVDQAMQDNLSCKRENILKSMEILTLWTLIWHATVPPISLHVLII